MTCAVVGVLVEGGALVLVGLLGLVVVVARGSTSLAAALVLVAVAVGAGVALVAAARALHRGRRRARGPVVTWQLLQVATAVALATDPGRPGRVAAVAVAVAVVGVGVTAAVLSRPAVRYLGRT